MGEMVKLANKISEPVEEAIRSLRTNIQFCGADKPIKTICMTSCQPNEGKSTTSLNLAVSMANAGKKVVHVDADMRKPRIYKNVTSVFSVGLSNYLSGMIAMEDAISETNVENLHMILSGPKPPNPAELIGTERFRVLLTNLSDQYDYVIIDTPPLGGMIDAAIIASLVDGTIMLVEYNAIDYKKAAMVKEQLEKANARILGIVLNKIPRREFKQYYSYYDYRYRRYGNKHSEEKVDAV